MIWLIIALYIITYIIITFQVIITVTAIYVFQPTYLPSYFFIMFGHKYPFNTFLMR